MIPYELSQAYLRAFVAEDAGRWHVAAQHYLACLEEAGDSGAASFFAAKLARAYRAMNMPQKASYFELYSSCRAPGSVERP